LISNRTNLDPRLFTHFTDYSFGKTLAGFDESGESRIHASRPNLFSTEQATIAILNEHNYCWICARKILRSAMLILTASDMATVNRLCSPTAGAAESLPIAPLNDGSCVREQGAFTLPEHSTDLVKILKLAQRRLIDRIRNIRSEDRATVVETEEYPFLVDNSKISRG
jgi:hypothetical protein